VTNTALVIGALLAACAPPTDVDSPFQDAISANASRFGIPAVWITSVMSVESGGRACRDGQPLRSPAGAVGLMQLMKPTWLQMRDFFGLGNSIGDPSANIAAGAAYLRLMYDRFGYPGLFAAYNAGPKRYAQSLSGRPLPLETRHYVDAVLARIGASIVDAAPAPSESSLSLFVAIPPVKDFDRRVRVREASQSGETLFILSR
jgi:soluble lytic murein transglycosylase-like protein